MTHDKLIVTAMKRHTGIQPFPGRAQVPSIEIERSTVASVGRLFVFGRGQVVVRTVDGQTWHISLEEQSKEIAVWLRRALKSVPSRVTVTGSHRFCWASFASENWSSSFDKDIERLTLELAVADLDAATKFSLESELAFAQQQRELERRWPA